MSEQDGNLRIAETICRQFAWNEQTFNEGDFVALLDGNVVAVAPSAEQAIAALRALAADPRRGMVIEVSRPTVDVIR